MKKFKEIMIFVGILLVPIVAGAAESKQDLFRMLFVFGLVILLAWDAGMLKTKPNKE